jgi:hypothetical protein
MGECAVGSVLSALTAWPKADVVAHHLESRQLFPGAPRRGSPAKQEGRIRSVSVVGLHNPVTPVIRSTTDYVPVQTGLGIVYEMESTEPGALVVSV